MDTIFAHTVHFIANATPWTLDEHGRSPLHYCSLHLSLPSLEILLSIGHFDVNQEDCLGNTPLLTALQSYSSNNNELVYHTVSLLLQYGANPNKCFPTSPSPLMIAVLQKDLHLVNLLLHYGADPTWCMEGEDTFVIPVGSSAFSLGIQKPLDSDKSSFTPTELQILWNLLHPLPLSKLTSLLY